MESVPVNRVEVTPRQAARELGISAARLRPLLAVSHDPILLALCEGISVQREPWEASFAEAATLAAVRMPLANVNAKGPRKWERPYVFG